MADETGLQGRQIGDASQININELAYERLGRYQQSTATVVQTIKSPAEIEAEIAESRAENDHRRSRENRTFNAIAALIVIIVVVCVVIIFSNIYPPFGQTIPDTHRQWAQATLVTLFTTGLGYLAGIKTS